MLLSGVQKMFFLRDSGIMTLHAPEQIQEQSEQELTKEFQITKSFGFMTESIPDVSPNPGRTWGLP